MIENISSKNQNVTGRKQWLIDHRVLNLTRFLKEHENIDISVNQTFEQVVQADPSVNKSAIQWITESYLREGFLWEDLLGGQTSKVSQTLQLFARYKKNLNVEQRNIYRYQTLADLYKSIQTYHIAALEKTQALKGNELKRSEKQRAIENTHVLLTEENLKIIVPLTQEASEWWGMGTRWCTAAQQNNMFNYYNQQAPLMILLFQDHENRSRRLQLWVISNKFQFMDETDAEVQRDFIQANWNSLSKILNYSAVINGLALSFIPEKYQTAELCENSVSTNGWALMYIDETKITSQLCKIACEQFGQALEDVPERFKTFELCLIAVKQNGEALQFVPEQFRTLELCEQAMINNHYASLYVPKKYQTAELYQLGCKNNGLALWWVPEQFKNYEIYKIACQQNGNALRYVPEDFITKELCNLSVKNNGLSLSTVPEQFITQRLCKIAVEQNGNFLELVPEQFKTQEMVNLAVNNKGKALRFVPFGLKTPQLCKQACEKDPTALLYVPEKLKTFELCYQAYKQNQNILKSVPMNIQNQENFRLLIEDIKSKPVENTKKWVIEQVIQAFDSANTNHTTKCTNSL